VSKKTAAHIIDTITTATLKRVAFDVIQDSHFGCGMIHCGSKENRDGQAATDGVA
jgi:hypothetical protein